MEMFDYYFNFKGTRDYVQGADIIDHSLNNLAAIIDPGRIINFKYAGHEMLRENAVGILDKVPVSNPNSLITFSYSGETFFLSILK